MDSSMSSILVWIGIAAAVLLETYLANEIRHELRRRKKQKGEKAR